MPQTCIDPTVTKLQQTHGVMKNMQAYGSKNERKGNLKAQTKK